MPLTIGVVKEHESHEARVALTPDVAAKLIELGASVHLESGAGERSHYPTRALQRRATLHPSAADVSAAAQVLLKVQPPTLEEARRAVAGRLVDRLHAAARPTDLVRRFATARSRASLSS